MFKILQAKFQQYLTREPPDLQAVFRKGNQRSNFQYLLDHRESKGIPEKHLLMTCYLKISCLKTQNDQDGSPIFQTRLDYFMSKDHSLLREMGLGSHLLNNCDIITIFIQENTHMHILLT